MTWSTARQGLLRITLAILVGAVAVLCLSSPLFAAIVGMLTIAVVTIDIVAQRGREAPPSDPPDRITVDLSRRRRGP